MCNQAAHFNSWPRGHVNSTAKAKGLLAAALMAVLMAVVHGADAENVLANADFENGLDSWTSYGSGENMVVSQDPNHSGVRVLKNWGCWCSPTNQQGEFQDVDSSVGNVYAAGGLDLQQEHRLGDQPLLPCVDSIRLQDFNRRQQATCYRRFSC